MIEPRQGRILPAWQAPAEMGTQANLGSLRIYASGGSGGDAPDFPWENDKCEHNDMLICRRKNALAN